MATYFTLPFTGMIMNFFTLILKSSMTFAHTPAVELLVLSSGLSFYNELCIFTSEQSYLLNVGSSDNKVCMRRQFSAM